MLVTGCRIGLGLIPRFNPRFLYWLLAATLAEDWFQGLIQGFYLGTNPQPILQPVTNTETLDLNLGTNTCCRIQRMIPGYCQASQANHAHLPQWAAGLFHWTIVNNKSDFFSSPIMLLLRKFIQSRKR